MPQSPSSQEPSKTESALRGLIETVNDTLSAFRTEQKLLEGIRSELARVQSWSNLHALRLSSALEVYIHEKARDQEAPGTDITQKITNLHRENEHL